MGFLFSRLIRNIVIAYVIFSGVQYLLRWKTYNISPKEFRNIASKAQGADNVASAVSRLTTDLRRTYGPAIAAETSWVALSLGGLPLKALFLHASLTEFIGVIGTPFPTSGRVGMHWSNSTCTVLTGSVARLLDVGHMPNKETFSAGGNFRHGQFESHIYSFGADTYVVCYGRGVMPVSGLWAATGALANGEPFSLARLIYTYGHESFNQLSLALTHTFNYYKSKATGKSEL
ncbi:ERG2 and Sigma1 receptor like protein [Ancylostoma caninum]|uniref:Sigma non-opioid intracellular receptor 1 n=1 Tax=Ancylostoma caninum TaxID=29170 RepID=A0A368GD50_ANCCA|nr:ERG2 and Sigma1 receptor like protein [Ancylostoma caninum]